MKPYLLKRSIARKCVHKISVKQHKSIISEIKNNLHAKDNFLNVVKQSNAISNTEDATCSSFATNSKNTSDTTPHINIENESLSVSSDNVSSSFNSSTIQSFRDRLGSCFVDNNLTHV